MGKENLTFHIGFGTKFHTLWSSEEIVDSSNNVTIVYTFIQNLAFDYDKAVQKAIKFGCTDTTINPLFNGKKGKFTSKKTMDFNNENFIDNKGKIINIDKNDFNKLVWYYFNKYKNVDIEKHLLANGYLVEHNNEIMSIHRYEMIFKKSIDENINIIDNDDETYYMDITFQKNLGGYFDDIVYDYFDEHKKNRLLFFTEYKSMYYNGFTYYLPKNKDGKGIKIKHKRFRLLVDKKSNTVLSLNRIK